MAIPSSSHSDAVAEQHALIGIGSDFSGSHEAPPDFEPNRRPGTEWFAKAGMGLFLHFGTSAAHGLTDLSWGMIKGTNYDSDKPGEPSRYKMPPNEYFSYAEKFDPKLWDPDRLLEQAARAGFRYAVMTTKHHEGYTLWPSQHGDFGVKQFLQGRDLVKPFVEACRKHGLKVGLYFSPPDWYFNRHHMSYHYRSETTPGRQHLGLDHEPIELTLPPAGWREKFHCMVRSQINELLTNYGKIDLLWFDGRPAVISFEEIRALQPDILVNSRMHGYGDFKTPECHLPATPPGGWWELCDTTDQRGRWGYFNQKSLRSSGELLSRFCHVRSMGGNYLLNFGPNGNGVLSVEAATLLQEITDWMQEYHAAVHDVQCGLYPIGSPVPDTYAPEAKRRYLFLGPDWTDEQVEIRSLEAPLGVFLRGVELAWQKTAVGLKIEIPEGLRSLTVDVVVVDGV